MEDNLNNKKKDPKGFLKNIDDKKDEIFYAAASFDNSSLIDSVIKPVSIHLDYKETMWQICKMWIEECAKEDRYPFDVLIPVPFSDIKDSEREGYMEIIMEKFRKEKKKNKG